jgi:hypothetical protein
LSVLCKFYDGRIGNLHELYLREPEKQIPFIKGMIALSVKKLMA